MAASPKYKVFNPEGEYVGCVKYAELAAPLVGVLGKGAQVRFGHSKRWVLWTEDENADGEAGESYDHAADVMRSRCPAAGK